MKHRKRWRPHRHRKLYQKVGRSSRQSLKRELRTMMLGEEELDLYGDIGTSAVGAGRDLEPAA